MKKIIGVIARPDKNITSKNVFIMYDAFKNIILENNMLPLNIIPPTTNINSAMKSDELKDFYNLLNLCDGLILQGGDEFYDYDKKVVEYAINKDVPILGICLGMQVMASLEENNLKKLDSNLHNQEKNYAHSIKISENSLLYKILNKDKINVNSYHKEHVISSGIYKIVAKSNDNVIEAIEYNKNKFNVGLQFHPEKTYYIDDNMKKIFKYFFDIVNT